MLSIEQLRKLDPENEYSDEELIKLRDAIFPINEKILDKYFDDLQK